jgi:transcription elongation factor GreA-like protein/transcription elongation GreA/GreB family factor
MSYLEDFSKRIQAEDLQGCLTLWEEYCAGDEVDVAELEKILKLLLESRFASTFGKLVEEVLPLWEKIENESRKYDILRLLLDLETTQSPTLADLAYTTLEKRFGNRGDFQEKIRLVGLRNRIGFQGAIRNFELLEHLGEGRFVYHSGGWGTGEILEVSPVREEIVLEFESVPGRKILSFENAFRNLRPLPDDHFLARRFGDPDLFEEEARKDPVVVIHLLLRDLGPKTAADIKEELCDLVIPEQDWAKWWQSARGRLKRDTRIETPPNVREPFRLREAELSHLERMKEALQTQATVEQLIVTAYSFARDFSEISKSPQGQEAIRERMREILDRRDPTQAQRLEVYALLEDLFGEQAGVSFADEVGRVEDLAAVINAMEIIAYKKRVLVALRRHRGDWKSLFVDFLFTLHQGALRDYLLRELMAEPDTAELRQRIESLLERPAQQPHFFLWYFQKVMRGDEDVLYRDKAEQCRFFEALLILLHQLELAPENRELVKRIYNLITAGRYQLVRDVLDKSTLEFALEFLLLISKSHTFAPQDIKIMHALAEVVHPSLVTTTSREREAEAEEVIWTTEEGYKKLRRRLEELSREMIDNARDIEKAREHGDLRENAEYKAAQERRVQLQAEGKMLSQQANQVRILTEVDVVTDRVGVGTKVTLIDAQGNEQQYTLLGPWDADPDQHVLAVQSRFAQAMVGLQSGETFTHQHQIYRVSEIASFFEAHA